MAKLVAGAGLLAAVIFGMTQAGSSTRRPDGVILDEGDDSGPIDDRQQVGDARQTLESEKSRLSVPLS
jgi:hypothetical protein